MIDNTFNSSFDGDPSGYDEIRKCWLNDRRELFVCQYLAQLAREKPLSVLEIGSGTGWLLGRLSHLFEQCHFHGIDPIPEYVAFAAERYGQKNLSFSVGTGESLPNQIGNGSIDVILSNDVLHHVESLSRTVTQVSKVCCKRARWYAIEPNPFNPYAFVRQATRHGERNFWPNRFVHAAKQSGWRLAGRRYMFLIPPTILAPPEWMKMLERYFERFLFFGGGIALDMEYMIKGG